jgi:hypothetical protein
MGTKTYYNNVWKRLGLNKVRLSHNEFVAINRSISLGLQRKWSEDMTARAVANELKEGRNVSNGQYN